MDEKDDDVHVTYSIKELFLAVNDKLTLIDAKLVNKTDIIEYKALESRVESLEKLRFLIYGAIIGIGINGGINILQLFNIIHHS